MAANPPRKKDGEKAELLKSCGQALFGCEGDILVTQGIYCCPPFGKKAECFCKRAVWVPRHFSLNALKETFLYYCAEFPLTVTEDTPVGVCGQSPTRTAHADDKVFLILAQFVKKKFSVIGTVSIAQDDADSPPYITEIKSGSSLFDAVTWVREESSLHRTSNLNKPCRYRKRKQNQSHSDEVKFEDHEILETPMNKKARIDYSQSVEPFPKTPEMNHEKHTIISTPMAPSSGDTSPDVIQQMYLPDPTIVPAEIISVQSEPAIHAPVETVPVYSNHVVQATAETVPVESVPIHAPLSISIPLPCALNSQNPQEEYFMPSISPSLSTEHPGLFSRSPSSIYAPQSDYQFGADPWYSLPL